MVPGKCDLSCIWCNFRGNPPDEQVEFDQLSRRLKDLFAGGVRDVCFGRHSSEPTTYPDFPRLVRLARRTGFRSISLLTSGLRLADPAYARHLRSCGLSRVFISLPGVDGPVADVLLGKPGATAAKLAAIEHCAHEGMRVTVALVFVRPALRTMRRSVDALRDVRSRCPAGIGLSGNLLSSVADPTSRRYLLFWPTYEEVAWTMRDVRTSMRGFLLLGSDAPACVARSIPGLKSDGRPLPWVSYVKPARPCGKCRLASKCPGVFAGYLQRLGGRRLLDPVQGTAPPAADPKTLLKQIRELKMEPAVPALLARVAGSLCRPPDVKNMYGGFALRAIEPRQDRSVVVALEEAAGARNSLDVRVEPAGPSSPGIVRAGTLALSYAQKGCRDTPNRRQVLEAIAAALQSKA